MRKFIFLTLIFIATLLSCAPDPLAKQPSQPDGYVDLYAAYKSGVGYTDITADASYTTVTLEDGSSVRFRLADICIHDCRESSPGITAVDADGEWMLNGVKLGIWEDISVEDSQAVPVYIYYLSDKLTVRLSNGNSFVIKYIDPETKGAIPLVYITTTGNKSITSKEDYVTGTLRISDKDLKYSSSKEFSASMKIRGRGNSTWSMPKKPYKIKLDEKAEMFGMHKDKEWCLLANYADKSLVRNRTAMEISRICDMKWTPGMRSCEVYLNGKYQGVYDFCEHKKVAEHRVNIDTEAGDILFELDQDQDEPVSWVTTHGTPMMFSDPDQPTQEQIDFAKKYFADIEEALWNKDFKTVYGMIDRESFINNYIIQELTMNIDGNFRKSNYLTLTKGGRLEMYFVWDFDLSMGNADYYGNPPGNGPEGWWVKNQGALGLNHGWYYRLFMDPDFVDAVQDRWNQVRDRLEQIPDYIDKQAAIIGDAAIQRNFAIWSITDNGWWNSSRKITTYQAELDNLKTFYSKRFAWLDSNIAAL